MFYPLGHVGHFDARQRVTEEVTYFFGWLCSQFLLPFDGLWGCTEAKCDSIQPKPWCLTERYDTDWSCDVFTWHLATALCCVDTLSWWNHNRKHMGVTSYPQNCWLVWRRDGPWLVRKKWHVEFWACRTRLSIFSAVNYFRGFTSFTFSSTAVYEERISPNTVWISQSKYLAPEKIPLPVWELSPGLWCCEENHQEHFF